MAPGPRVKAAFKAMKDIGIPEEKTKPALKKLLNLYDKNWDLIEEENYRVLADTIFEYEETEVVEKEKVSGNFHQGEVDEEAAETQDEPERPLKRLRLKHQNQAAPSLGQHSLSSPVALKIPKLEPGGPEASSSQRAQPLTSSPQPLVRNKGKQPLIYEPLAIVLHDHSHLEYLSNASPVGRQAEHKHLEVSSDSGALFCSKDVQGSGASQSGDGIDKSLGALASSSAERNHIQEADVSKKMPANIDIASSLLGEVKLYLSCNPGPEGKVFYFPDLQTVLKAANDICLKKYKIVDPEFTILKVMKEFCEYVGKLITNADILSQDRSNQQDAEVNCRNGIDCLQSNGSLNVEYSANVAAKADETENDANLSSASVKDGNLQIILQST